MKVYMGLDVGSSTCHAIMIKEDGSIFLDRKIQTSEKELINLVKTVRQKIILNLEASNLARWVRRTVKPYVHEVHVSDTKSNSWIAKDVKKNDRIDAYKLAELMRMGNVNDVYHSDDDHRAIFKEIVQTYEQLTRTEARIKIQLKGRMRGLGLICKNNDLYDKERRKQWVKQIKSKIVHEMIIHICDQLDHAIASQEKMKKLMVKESKQYPEIKAFQKIPGVGIICACKFSGYIQTPHRFSNKRKLWSYCCLGIVHRTSEGKLRGRIHLNRAGIGSLKDVSRKIFEACIRSKKDNMFKRFYQEALRKSHNKIHARLSTQRKILTVMWTIWRNGCEYNDNAGKSL